MQNEECFISTHCLIHSYLSCVAHFWVLLLVSLVSGLCLGWVVSQDVRRNDLCLF